MKVKKNAVQQTFETVVERNRRRGDWGSVAPRLLPRGSTWTYSEVLRRSSKNDSRDPLITNSWRSKEGAQQITFQPLTEHAKISNEFSVLGRQVKKGAAQEFIQNEWAHCPKVSVNTWNRKRVWCFQNLDIPPREKEIGGIIRTFDKDRPNREASLSRAPLKEQELTRNEQSTTKSNGELPSILKTLKTS